MKKDVFDIWGTTIFIAFLIAIAYGAYLSYKSIDYKILNKLENTKLVLPSPIPAATASAALPTSSKAPGSN